MATQQKTLQEVITAGWPATENKMKQVTIMAKLDNGIGLEKEEIKLVDDLSDDEGNELLTRAKKVAGMGEDLQKYLTSDLKPLREALKKPSQQLGAWKKLCWKTGEDVCPEIAPLDDQGGALGDMMAALGDGEANLQSFVKAQYENFLDGKPDILGSSMVVTYLCETNADFKAHMNKGLQMVELHNPTDGASQVLNLNDELEVVLGSACDNDAVLCLNLNEANRYTINTLTKDKYHTFHTNTVESHVIVFLHSKDDAYVTVAFGKSTTRIGVYDTFITSDGQGEYKNFETDDELVVFALKWKIERNKPILESYVPISHSESGVPYTLCYQNGTNEPTADIKHEKDNVVAKFTLPSGNKIKFFNKDGRIESLQMSTGGWVDVKKWPDVNNLYNSVTVKNGTADEYACYVMLNYTTPLIKEIRSAYDSLTFFEVSKLTDATPGITFESESVAGGGRPNASVVNAHLRLETLLLDATEV